MVKRGIEFIVGMLFVWMVYLAVDNYNERKEETWACVAYDDSYYTTTYGEAHRNHRMLRGTQYYNGQELEVSVVRSGLVGCVRADNGS